MGTLDSLVVVCLIPLAVWILVSGLDDLFLVVVCLAAWIRRKWFGLEEVPAPPPTSALIAEKRIAILIPLWHEHNVVRRMLEHNLAAIRYGAYEIFVGVYPNDEPTLDAVREAEARFAKVHVAVCPHDGPTSKADCLNWIFEHIQSWEEERGTAFDFLILHDAEDLAHPEELRWISHYGDRYGMIQIPVLPLPTPLSLLTHGVYCDEFAEFQTKDIPARQLLGGFIPSNGVGTGYARWALEALARENGGAAFDPACLTEDYEMGYRLHQIGCRQIFVNVRFDAGVPVATREYFPKRLRQALRQRTRWVMGISLQGWERHGWKGPWRQRYWFWRDRKGLLGNPASILANVLLLYGGATWAVSLLRGSEWGLGRAAGGIPSVLWLTWLLQCLHLGVRAGCAARIYGWRFAAGVPIRVLWANWLNCAATVAALHRYLVARMQREPLAWVKTEHSYPVRAALAPHRRPLGAILVETGAISQDRLDRALASQPSGLRLGEHLRSLGWLDEDQVYGALSLQQNVPLEYVDPECVPRRISRALPGAVARRWRLVPVRIRAGRMHLAGPELPTEEAHRDLERFTRLSVEFQFVTPSNFEELLKTLSPGGRE